MNKNIEDSKYIKINEKIFDIPACFAENYLYVKDMATYIYKYFGDYHTEQVYQNSLECLFRERGYKTYIEKEIDVMFHNECVGVIYADLYVEKDNIKFIIEVKKNAVIKNIQLGQLAKYLSCMDINEGFVINFINNNEICYYLIRIIEDNQYNYIYFDGKTYSLLNNVGSF